jgi:hypothetical protein
MAMLLLRTKYLETWFYKRLAPNGAKNNANCKLRAGCARTARRDAGAPRSDRVVASL